MAIQQYSNQFGKERAERYKGCMERCPTTRYLEILPLLCVATSLEISQKDVVDLGSGTGYLADFFEGVANSVLRVDKSRDMLEASGSDNYIVADMSSISKLVGEEKADFITCLASFHHAHIPENPNTDKVFAIKGTRYFSPERHLDIESSLQHQFDAIRDWTKILRPGGHMCLIDVPGYPDPAWEAFWDKGKRHNINTKGYYFNFLENVADWRLNVPTEKFKQFFKGRWQEFFANDPHMQDVCNLIKKDFSMKELLKTYNIPELVLKSSGPMVPTDFFDDVIDGYGMQRHFGFFPRETSLKQALLGAGMIDVKVGTFPTPWLFESQKEAAWFVHELFGLGAKWYFGSIPSKELDKLIKWLDQYLGFYKDDYGRTLLYWQLSYFVAKKREEKD